MERKEIYSNDSSMKRMDLNIMKLFGHMKYRGRKAHRNYKQGKVNRKGGGL